jgi:hypothetical protein
MAACILSAAYGVVPRRVVDHRPFNCENALVLVHHSKEKRFSAGCAEMACPARGSQSCGDRPGAFPGELAETVKVGYARVSTDEQNLDLQRQALEAAGCEDIFEDHGVSGAAVSRPALGRALATIQEGDVLVVWKLDRLGRSLPHLIEVITGLRKAGIGFCSLQEQIDTTSPGGRFYLHILAALAEFERAHPA